MAKIMNGEWQLAETTVGFKCDVCDTQYTDVMDTQEFLHYSDVGGYNSIFGDGVSKEIDMCEHCVKKILGTWITTKGEWDVTEENH